MSPDDREARRALLLATIAAALGVALPACGGSNRGAPGARAPASSATATEVRERERPMRDAHCGRD
jgi:hypothetical protein